ncbi:hypothetical protein [Streptomyces lavendulocolor]|uniref:hypothetical protein n=1 Tax=Streptomyces lavendulocolor TaxID=67316 RepID=UPI003C30664F
MPTPTHPLAPRRRRATGFVVVLVILWVMVPEVVEIFAMWIGLIGALVSLPALGQGATPGRRSGPPVRTAFLEELGAQVREIGMVLLGQMARWSGLVAVPWRIV